MTRVLYKTEMAPPAVAGRWGTGRVGRNVDRLGCARGEGDVTPAGDGLLAGVRVLDLTIWRPGPYATQLLAEITKPFA